jgi:hypothetical protein
MQLKKFTLKEFEDNFWAVDVVKRKIMDLIRGMQICIYEDL